MLLPKENTLTDISFPISKSAKETLDINICPESVDIQDSFWRILILWAWWIVESISSFETKIASFAINLTEFEVPNKHLICLLLFSKAIENTKNFGYVNTIIVLFYIE